MLVDLRKALVAGILSRTLSYLAGDVITGDIFPKRVCGQKPGL